MTRQDHFGCFFGSAWSRIVWDGEDSDWNSHAREAPRVVAWSRYTESGRLRWIVLWASQRVCDPPGVTHYFDETETDLTVHNAYCCGKVPSYVYADWLEENGVQLPQVAYDLL